MLPKKRRSRTRFLPGHQSRPDTAAGVPPVVTALREIRRGRVSVELDGVPWRVLPAEPVARAGISVGVAIDRLRARRLRRELRRATAIAQALGALRQRDHSHASLDERLARRGITEAVRQETLATLERVGLVDDARGALARASVLAERGVGDLLIRDDLERRGFAAEHVAAALDVLEPEAERARRVVAARGGGARTLRSLAAKGFAEDVLEGLIADRGGSELG